MKIAIFRPGCLRFDHDPEYHPALIFRFLMQNHAREKLGLLRAFVPVVLCRDSDAVERR